jgi:hypothetical protein
MVAGSTAGRRLSPATAWCSSIPCRLTSPLPWCRHAKPRRACCGLGPPKKRAACAAVPALKVRQIWEEDAKYFLLNQHETLSMVGADDLNPHSTHYWLVSRMLLFGVAVGGPSPLATAAFAIPVIISVRWGFFSVKEGSSALASLSTLVMWIGFAAGMGETIKTADPAKTLQVSEVASFYLSGGLKR